MDPPFNPPLVHTVRRDGQVLGYVAVDTIVGGAACGGVRLMPDVGAEEMRALARSMTLKFGFLGFPQGGAKAGVIGDPEAGADVRRRRLVSFARGIAPWLRERRYRPHADMGTTTAEVREALAAVGVRLARRDLRPGARTDSGIFTALTVRAAARASATHLGLELRGRTVAIEGFGKVGGPLARMLARDGVCVVAVSTARGAIHDPAGLDVEALLARREEVGSRVVEDFRGVRKLPREDLSSLPVDVLLPCARQRAIHEGNVDAVRARIVAPGANNAFTPEARARLESRGVACLPGFVANCGGVLGGTMAFASVSHARIEQFVEARLEPHFRALLAEAERRGESVRTLAERRALARSETLAEASTRNGPVSRVVALALDAHRRGLLPASFVGALAPRWFERRILGGARASP